MFKFFIMIMVSFITLNASSLNWEKDYKSAIKKAKEQNKAIFVMVSAPTCPECNYMKKNVFTKDEVKNFINENFISYQFNIDDKNIPKEMQFWGIPRFYLSKDGEKVYNQKMGGLKTDKFLAFIKEDK